MKRWKKKWEAGEKKGDGGRKMTVDGKMSPYADDGRKVSLVGDSKERQQHRSDGWGSWMRLLAMVKDFWKLSMVL